MSHPRTPRRVAAVLLALLALLAFAVPAHAAGGQAGDCRDEPVPEAPGRGVTGWVNPAPKPLPPGAKFTADGVPRFAQYGVAGMRWNNYDLGCGSDTLNSPEAIIGTPIANWTFELSKFGVGLTDSITGAAFHPTFLGVFDPLIRNAVGTLQHTLFNRWVGVFLALAGLLLLYKASRLRFATAAVVAGWAVVVLAASSIIFTWPVVAGSFVDRGVGQVVGAVHSGINGDGAADPADAAAQSTYYAVLWNQWQVGEFGSSNSAVARKYADDLFDAQSLTWAEARIVEADPDGRGQELLDAKQDKFYDTANKIKDEDPDAYQYVTGKKSEARVGGALIALGAALCVLPLLLMSAVLIIASYIIVRIAVMLFPAIATIGVAYTFRGMVKGLAGVVGAAVINCVVFAVGAALNLLAIRILLSPSSAIPTWLGLLISLLVAVLMWFLLKPFRRLTHMASPNHNVLRETSNTVRRAGSKAGGLVKTGVVAAATGGAAGGAAAGAVLADEAAKPKTSPPRPQRTETYSAPDVPTAAPPTALPAAPMPAPAPALPPPGAPAAAPSPAAPVTPPAGSLPPPMPSTPTPALSTAPDTGAAPSVGEIPAPAHLPEPWPVPTATDPTVTSADPGAPTTMTTPADSPTSSTQPPTTTDDGLYYTPEGQSVPGPESEPDMVVPELDESGEEVHPFYRPDPDRQDVPR